MKLMHTMLHRKFAGSLLFAVVTAASMTVLFLVATPAQAQISTTAWVSELLFSMLIAPFALLVNGMTYLLIVIARYNEFGTEPIVIKGWTIMRDLSNMFFVVIMLIIAMGTVVKWSVMNYRQNLRRLVIVALFINFTRTIVLFFIDVSQVFVLTFLSAVQEALQAGVLKLLGLDTVFTSIAPASGGGTGAAAVIGIPTFLVVAIMMIIAAIVMAVILIIFLVRIIALWGLIITAPVAFMASTIPWGESYYKRWWSMLGQNLVSGPVMAAMLWLVFAIVSASGTNPTVTSLGSSNDASAIAIAGVPGQALFNFIVGIGLLIYSIRLAASAGGIGGKFASNFGTKGVNILKAGGKAAGRRVSFGRDGQGGLVGSSRRIGLAVADAATSKVGSLNIPVVGRMGRAINRGVAVTQSRFQEKANKTNAEYLGRLSHEQRKDLLEQKSIPGALGFAWAARKASDRGWTRTASALGGYSASRGERRQLMDKEKWRFLAKNPDGSYKSTDDKQLATWRNAYAQGASEDELWEFDKATAGRGLVYDKTLPPEKLEKDANYQQLKGVLQEAAGEGKLTSDMVRTNPELALEYASHSYTPKQMLDMRDKLNPQAQRALDDKAFEMYKDAKAKVDETKPVYTAAKEKYEAAQAGGASKEELEQLRKDMRAKQDVFEPHNTQFKNFKAVAMNADADRALREGVAKDLEEIFQELDEKNYKKLSDKTMSDELRVFGRGKEGEDGYVRGLSPQMGKRFLVAKGVEQKTTDAHLELIINVHNTDVAAGKTDGGATRLLKAYMSAPATRTIVDNYVDRQNNSGKSIEITPAPGLKLGPISSEGGEGIEPDEEEAEVTGGGATTKKGKKGGKRKGKRT